MQKSLRMGQSHIWNTGHELTQATLPAHLSTTISGSPALGGKRRKQTAKMFLADVAYVSHSITPPLPKPQLCDDAVAKGSLTRQPVCSLSPTGRDEGRGRCPSLNAPLFPPHPHPHLFPSLSPVSRSHHKPEVKMGMCADLRSVLDENVLPLLYREVFLQAYK